MPKDYGLTVIDDDDYSLDTVEDIPEILTDPKAVGEMSLADEKKAKEAIANLRKKVAFQLDAGKLREATKTLESISAASNILIDQGVWETVLSNVKTPMDVKFLSEFREKQVKTLQTLMRMDSIDGQGTAGFAKIGLSVEDESGNRTSVVLSKDG